MIKNNLLICLLFSLLFNISAQSKLNDIPVQELPSNVKMVVQEYIHILKNANSLEDCAKKMIKVAGGGLINESTSYVTLRNSIKPYSLKKDFNNIKFYAQPIIITRVNVSKNRTSGYGESAIKGTIYKVWIGKKEGVNGMPAPISILVPQNHKIIKSPKIIGIGSL